MIKCISPALTPTLQKDDILLSLKTLFSPQKFSQTQALSLLKKWFSDRFPSYNVILAESGRSLLELFLSNLGLQSGDQVLVQALTCSVVPGAIIKAKLTPIFVDTTDTFNMDTTDLVKKITTKSKVLIIQHSFACPDDLDTIKKICQKHHLILIEDCAHSLGVSFQDKPLGSFGDASFFSFGRDKVISSVWGGALLLKDKKIYQKIIKNTKFFHRNIFWVSKQLLYPFIISLVTNLYGFFALGKVIHFLAQKTGLITKAVSLQDKNIIKTDIYSFPNQLAVLANHQLDKLNDILQKRRSIAKSYSQIFNKNYDNNCGYLRYPILLKNKSKISSILKKSNIFLGDWYYQPLIPNIDMTKFAYKKSSCPNAEKTSKFMVNLPTNPNLNQKNINKLISLVKYATN